MLMENYICVTNYSILRPEINITLHIASKVIDILLLLKNIHMEQAFTLTFK